MKSPHEIAYDRPSPKLISFLKKYFSLVDYIPQNNNYVIFKEYFSSSSYKESKSSSTIEKDSKNDPKLESNINNINKNYGRHGAQYQGFSNNFLIGGG